jgi:hypothetical protein
MTTYLDGSIEGWMERDELIWLYETASTMSSVVEVGCWKGRSTRALLEGCKGTVHAVDHFQGSPGENRNEGDPHYEAKLVDIYSVFINNLMRYSNLVVHKMPSHHAANYVLNQGKSIDMVFLDGAHDEISVEEDIDCWTPIASRIICGHDYEQVDVGNAVRAKFGSSLQIYGRIWYYLIG